MNIYRRPSWSDLPPELLQLIASRLETHEDVCQFCYVCNMWRQSAANLLTPLRLHSKLPYKFAVNIPFIHSNGPFIIVSSAVYILRRNTDEGHWLVGVDQSNHGKLRLVHPLTRVPIRGLNTMDFPNFLRDFCPLRISAGYNLRFSNGVNEVSPDMTRKVIYWTNPNVESDSSPAEQSLMGSAPITHCELSTN